MNPIIAELGRLDSEMPPSLERRDGAAVLVQQLPHRIPPSEAAQPCNLKRVWELVGIFYMTSDRLHEALAIFWALYQQMLRARPMV